MTLLFSKCIITNKKILFKNLHDHSIDNNNSNHRNNNNLSFGTIGNDMSNLNRTKIFKINKELNIFLNFTMKLILNLTDYKIYKII